MRGYNEKEHKRTRKERERSTKGNSVILNRKPKITKYPWSDFRKF